ECLAGCFRGAIFSTGRVARDLLAAGSIRLVPGKVRRFDGRRRTLEAEVGGEVIGSGAFDRVYLAAGCPNTTEIVLRSLGAARSEPMADNSVYVFPILHLGP